MPADATGAATRTPEPPAPPKAKSSLSDRDKKILDFERQWAKHAGAKEEAIRAEFSLSAARYYQLLNAIIDLPDALRFDPLLVRRLQRARDLRMRVKATRVFKNSSPGAESSRPQPPESTD
jgi:hypothetical protein